MKLRATATAEIQREGEKRLNDVLDNQKQV